MIRVQAINMKALAGEFIPSRKITYYSDEFVYLWTKSFIHQHRSASYCVVMALYL